MTTKNVGIESGKKMSNQKLLLMLFFSVLLVLCTTLIQAQNNWGLTIRRSANFPTNDLGDAKLKLALISKALSITNSSQV